MDHPLPLNLTILSLTLTTASWASSWPPRTCGWASSCAGVHWSDFDTISLIVDVEHTLLDLIVYFPGGVYEGLLHIGGSLSGGLHEDQAMFPGKCLSLLSLHISPGFQVTKINLVFSKFYLYKTRGTLPGAPLFDPVVPLFWFQSLQYL